MSANSSTPPLLQPPPADMTDTLSVRQWMYNVYLYIFQLTLNGIVNFSLSTTGSVAAGTCVLTVNGLNSAGNTVVTKTVSIPS